MNPVKNPLYVPPGNAEERGDYALDIYAGCPHGCPYCYAPDVLRVSREKFRAHAEPRPGIVEALEKQLHEMREEDVAGKTAYLCPFCDPYPQGCDTSVTREVIQCLKRYGWHIRILTKGDGVRDADLLDMNDWYGVTLDGNRAQWDRETMTYGGLSQEELFESLKVVHKRANTLSLFWTPKWFSKRFAPASGSPRPEAGTAASLIKSQSGSWISGLPTLTGRSSVEPPRLSVTASALISMLRTVSERKCATP